MDAAAFRDRNEERAALGDVLLRPHRASLYISVGYRRDRFADPDLATIWDRVQKLNAAGVEPDVLAVCRTLREDRCDISPAFVAALCDGVPAQSDDNIRARHDRLQTLELCRKYAYQSARLDAQLVAQPELIRNGFIQHQIAALEALRPVGRDGLSAEDLVDAVDVVREGQRINDEGIRYRVDGIVPDYGTVGMLVAYAKVGKTTFGQAMSAAVAMGRPFLDRTTTAARVLVIAAEDPPEYTAWVARHLEVEHDRMTFYRRPIVLDANGLAQIAATVKAVGYGLVLIATWQAVVRGLIRDENDNAGAVQVVENVKAAARSTGVPWLIDAHSGKSEDIGDDADPSRAMRGASAAAGAADYMLFLRYADGAFGTQRKLSGKGRFVSLAPITLDFDPDNGTYSVVGGAKDLEVETTWRLIADMGALTEVPRTAADIARAAGLLSAAGSVTNTQRRRVANALRGRPDVAIQQELRYGQKTTLYRLLMGVGP